MALDNFRTQKIIWDKANRKIFEAIEANSGDSNGRKLVVQVINQETTEVLSGTTLSLGWKSRKGAKGLDAFNLVDASKGIFEIYYTTEMLSNIGNIEASLILIDSTSRIESSTFTISVRPSTVDDESVESENSFTALTEALVKVNDFDAQLAQTIKKGEASVYDINKNKGLLDETYMTEEFRQQMAGTAGISAVPANRGVTNLKLADKSVTLDKTDFIEVVSKNLFNKQDVIPNSTISNFGNIVASTGNNVSSFIPVKPSTDYTVEYVSRYAFYTVDQEFISTSLIDAYTSTTFTTPSNCYYIRIMISDLTIDLAHFNVGTSLAIKDEYKISLKNLSTDKKLQELLEDVSFVFNKQIPEPEINVGTYVSRLGNKVSNSSYFYTEPIALNEDSLVIFEGGGVSGAVSVISECDSEGNNIKPLVITSTSDLIEYKYKSDKDMFIIVSGRHTDNYKITTYQKSENFTTTKNDKDVDYSLLLSSVVCIGDSLTEGNTGGGIISTNYPYYISKMTEWTVENDGYSGITAKGYWDNHMREDYSPFDTAIIFLGQNVGLTDTLEADTSIVEGQTYVDYAETHTGSYCKIIERIKETNQDINIFLCTVPKNGGADKTVRNKVIKEIGNKYSIPVLDLYEKSVMDNTNGDIYRPIDDIHYGKIGYLTLAHEILTLLKQAIADNKIIYNN